MARPPKKGLSYFPKDTDFYDDEKIIDLLEDYGPLGLTIYDVILTLVYKDGYYKEIAVDKLASLTARYIGNKWIKNKDLIIQVIHRCADLGLFDKDLLLQGIVTSEGIQRRYSDVTARNKIDKSKYWLLEKNSSESVSFAVSEAPISVTETPISVTETPVSDAKMQQSKVNKSKLNKSNVVCGENQKNQSAEMATETTTYGPHGHIKLTANEFDDLCSEYAVKDITAYIIRVDKYIERSGVKPYASHYDTIKDWLKKDGIKPKPKSSLDLIEIVERAKHSTPKL